MPKRKIREIASFINGYLKRRGIKIEKLILFGSYARKTSRKDSDVDIAIVSRDFNKKDTFERARMLKGLDWSLVNKFMLPFDIVPLSLREWQESSSVIVSFAQNGQEVSLS